MSVLQAHLSSEQNKEFASLLPAWGFKSSCCLWLSKIVFFSGSFQCFFSVIPPLSTPLPVQPIGFTKWRGGNSGTVEAEDNSVSH